MHVGIRDGYLAGLGVESIWAAARRVSLTRLEVAVSPELTCKNLFDGKAKPYRVDTRQNRSKLCKAMQKHGCQIVAFCAVVKLRKDKAANDRQAEYLAELAEAAADMKVPVVIVPLVFEGLSEEAYLKQATAFVKSMADIARASRVQLAIENLGPYLNKRRVLKPLMEAAPDEHVGLALDITNMYWFGYPIDKIYELAELFAPHVRYAHAKNIKYPQEARDRQRSPGWKYIKYAEPVPTGDIDFVRILKILARAGFEGDVVIEDDSLRKFDAAGQAEAIKQDVLFLREVIVEQIPASQPAQQTRKQPHVRFETNLGDFVVELYPDKAPRTCENFLCYVEERFYDETIFHRIIDTFMIQGGGFTADGQPKTAGLHDAIRNEAKDGLKNEKGTIAMARTSEPHSATSQFFINVRDNANLDAPSFDGWGYCAFGKVIEGMGVVDKIKNMPTRVNPQMGGEKSEPIDPPVIQKAYRLN
jgi:cyclophilin family peptidyl-prolyl cis-trans isomerase/sugar phosphate isomerase/epimerase